MRERTSRIIGGEGGLTSVPPKGPVSDPFRTSSGKGRAVVERGEKPAKGVALRHMVAIVTPKTKGDSIRYTLHQVASR